ncbi:hypothetical protein DFJ77DRAFT_187536 [Powellomyces hirtus]|nr:hypothetical protein DFJ77DRAFT_187536 [Powellomyces hirtus]
MPQSTRGGGGRGRGRGRGAASAAPSGALAMARTPSNVSISSDGVPGTPTSTATARASPAPARPPLIRVASGPQISSAPTSASPTTPNATASVNLQTLSSIQTPGHPQYQQYMAALNYYMTQFSVGGGMSQGAPGAASASVSPASTTPNATPPGTPQMGTATAAVDLTRLPNLQMPARPTSAGSASAARPGKETACIRDSDVQGRLLLFSWICSTATARRRQRPSTRHTSRPDVPTSAPLPARISTTTHFLSPARSSNAHAPRRRRFHAYDGPPLRSA